jgi:hypothetical protein
MDVTRTEKFGRFTIVEVKGVVNVKGKDKKLTGVGISRQSDGDVYNDNMAENIAKGRAIKALEKKSQGKKINNMFMG